MAPEIEDPEEPGWGQLEVREEGGGGCEEVEGGKEGEGVGGVIES